MIIKNLGIGIDVVDIDRFRNVPINNKKDFYNKIFTESELRYCLRFKDPYPHFAGKFAIKEAVKKSLSFNIHVLKIETSHYNSKPNVSIKNKKYKFRVSLSHDNNIAIAVVISEKI